MKSLFLVCLVATVFSIGVSIEKYSKLHIVCYSDVKTLCQDVGNAQVEPTPFENLKNSSITTLTYGQEASTYPALLYGVPKDMCMWLGLLV